MMSKITALLVMISLLMVATFSQEINKHSKINNVHFNNNLSLIKINTLDNNKSYNKSPILAGTLSLFVPSLGHAYAGDWSRGLFFLMYRAGAGIITLNYHNDNNIVGLFAGMGIVMTVAEIIDVVKLVKGSDNASLSNTQSLSRLGLNIVPLNNQLRIGATFNF